MHCLDKIMPEYIMWSVLRIYVVSLENINHPKTHSVNIQEQSGTCNYGMAMAHNMFIRLIHT